MTDATLSFQHQQGALPLRLDHFLTTHMSQVSRTGCQRLIATACVAVNGVTMLKPSYLIQSSMVVTVALPSVTQHVADKSNPLIHEYAIDIVADHERFMIINKPAGLMVHPAPTAGNIPTLVDWIYERLPHLASQGDASRPGIVHRLDKDTSGLMIIPKDCHAHAQFSDMFKAKSITKEYCAIVVGNPSRSGTISYNIVRHPTHRTQMTHSLFAGREACTRYEVQRYFEDAALMTCFPATGRTHQIRVHCAAIGFPIIGDTVYGKSSPYINRQALHAAGISFTFEGKQYSFRQNIPQDMEYLMTKLEAVGHQSL